METKKFKIIGYGVCGTHESQRYLKATLDEFKRLCDHTVIVGNNLSAEDKAMINSYGFELLEDDRIWGESQHKIKQDLMYWIARYTPEYCVALDMDEVFDPELTKDKLVELLDEFESLYFYIVNLWNDGWNRRWSFWNVRAWKWNGNTKISNRPLHCGLAPEWCYFYGSYAPYFVVHHGLKKKADRVKKIERYQKFDPQAKYKDVSYYNALSQDESEKLDYDFIREAIRKEVGVQRKKVQTEVKDKVFYIVEKDGREIDVPERNLEETLKRGFKLVKKI